MSAEPVPGVVLSADGQPTLVVRGNEDMHVWNAGAQRLFTRATLAAAVAAARAEERALQEAEIASLRKRLDSCQRGYTVRLSDAEMKPAMDAVMKRIKDDPGYRVSLLHKAGILNEDGTLSEDYKS